MEERGVWKDTGKRVTLGKVALGITSLIIGDVPRPSTPCSASSDP